MQPNQARVAITSSFKACLAKQSKLKSKDTWLIVGLTQIKVTVVVLKPAFKTLFKPRIP